MPALVRTGPLNVVEALVRQIVAERRVAIAALAPSQDLSFERMLRSMGAELTVYQGAKWNVLGARNFLKAWRHASGIDLVSAHGLRPTVLSVGLGAPCVATVHSEIAEDFRLEYSALVAFAGLHAYVHSLRRVDGIVAVSGGVREHLGELGLGASVVRNGVDCGHWRAPSQAERARARSELGLAGERVAAVVGRLIQRKDPLRAIALAQAVLGPSDLILVAGDGPLVKDVLEAQPSRDKARVRVLGSTDDVRTVLWASDLFVSAALSEGLPMAAIEAAATGLPLALSNIRPHRDIAQELRGVVALFDRDAPQSSGGIEIPLVDRATAASAVAASSLSAASMAKQYLAQFDAMIAERE